MDNIIELTVYNYMQPLRIDKSNRELSFWQCYIFFNDNRKNNDKTEIMALYLYYYLASWGMLHNSFLMQKDYKFLIGIIEILKKEKFDCLLTDEFQNGLKQNKNKIICAILNLKEEIKGYFLNEKYFKDGKPVEIENATDTLISKIILGTFGSVIAYDTNVKKYIQRENICQTLNRESLNKIFDFTIENIGIFKKIQDKIKNEFGMDYPIMKIVDSYFWQSVANGKRSMDKN